jgi:hypothetical protein
MICKIQRALASTDKNFSHKVLIYDEERTHVGEFNLDQETIDELFEGYEVKVYWEGSVNDDGQFVPERKIPNEEWPSW